MYKAFADKDGRKDKTADCRLSRNFCEPYRKSEAKRS